MFPVVLIAGPRQCGKTTLAAAALKGWRYFDLERPRDIDLVSADIEGFLEQHHSKVVIDEVQRLPELFPALRSAVDRGGARPGQFVLTGSALPSWRNMAGESLAGRVGILELTPFRADELSGRPSWLGQRWFWGGFPPVYKRVGRGARRPGSTRMSPPSSAPTSPAWASGCLPCA